MSDNEDDFVDVNGKLSTGSGTSKRVATEEDRRRIFERETWVDISGKRTDGSAVYKERR